MSQVKPMIGRTVGNYVIGKLIGQGGMGAVYLAEHPRIGRKVAVKVLLPQLSQSAELVQRFFNEARAATAIANEHIIDVLDFGELDDGASYIVMEWLEGRSLAELLREQKKLPLDRVIRIARGIGEALTAAHANGIVHRDLKPDNIFLVRKGGDPEFVKVLDFGIAKLLADGADLKTRTGAIMGTPHYMSPEQCNGTNVDERTDVYALGVILFEMLTGRLPFEAGGLAELLVAHLSKPPPPLRSLDTTIPPVVELAVLQALEKDRARRFQSVEALVAALGGTSPTVPPVVATQPPVIAVQSPVVTALPSMATVPPVVVAARPLSTLHGPNARLWVMFAGVIAAIVGVGAIAIFRTPTAQPVAAIPAPADPSAAPAPTPAPAQTPAPAAKSSTATWVLSSTDCPPNTIVRSARVTTTGSRVHVRAAGFPDVHGTIDSDGKFTVSNQFGQCKGRAHDGVSSETCRNFLGASCHATYTVSE